MYVRPDGVKPSAIHVRHQHIWRGIRRAVTVVTGNRSPLPTLTTGRLKQQDMNGDVQLLDSSFSFTCETMTLDCGVNRLRPGNAHRAILKYVRGRNVQHLRCPCSGMLS